MTEPKGPVAPPFPLILLPSLCSFPSGFIYSRIFSPPKVLNGILLVQATRGLTSKAPYALSPQLLLLPLWESLRHLCQNSLRNIALGFYFCKKQESSLNETFVTRTCQHLVLSISSLRAEQISPWNLLFKARKQTGYKQTPWCFKQGNGQLLVCNQ